MNETKPSKDAMTPEELKTATLNRGVRLVALPTLTVKVIAVPLLLYAGACVAQAVASWYRDGNLADVAVNSALAVASGYYAFKGATFQKGKLKLG